MAKFLTINQITLNGELCMKTIMFNCDDIAGTPVKGYLLRERDCCTPAIQYELTTDITKIDANSLNGVIVYDKNGNQFLFDVATVDALRLSCDSCCGAEAVPVVNAYNNILPPFTDPATAIYCITRSDDGGAAAVQKTTLDYMSVVSTLYHKSNNGAGVSKYQVTALKSPPPIGTDTVAAGACV